MNLLIKQVKILDPNSPHNGYTLDIFIENGVIQLIQPDLNIENIEIFDAKGACASPGWMDVGVQSCDPGFEYREDLYSVTKAAAAGGFTAIAIQPNTDPVIDSKSEVLYIKKNTQGFLVDCYPIGAVSENCEGKDITEMLDMRLAGALAFSDGRKSLQHSGLILRALEYVLPFNGIIINQPLDKAIAGDGQMHEGIISTMLGLKGIPNLAEELMVERDLHLLAYADSRLHIANVSTAGAVARIREAKARGLRVTASVAALNLLFEDEAIAEFESNYKVMPPLRSAADREALIAGLEDNTLDFISSNHTPVDPEGKNLEFPYADFGAIGLQTAFATSRAALKDKLSLEQLIEKLAIQPRRIFGLDVPRVESGQAANLTIFDPDKKWAFQEADIRSKSKNSPLIGKELIGKVLAIINNRQSEIFVRP
ncbi:MAG: dihydroorotase [Saprospiraceae bacterium]|nr:dihydroorotase [Saprospiraceae bacterium]